MLRKITDIWPSLLRQYQGLESEEDAEVTNEEEAEPAHDEDIAVDFAQRVLDLFDVFPERAAHHRTTWQPLRPGASCRLELERVNRE